MRIVVTGASGFLGSMVARRLAGRAVEVVRVARRPLPGAIQVTDYAHTPDGDVLVHLAEEKDRSRAHEEGDAGVEAARRVLHALLGKPWQRVIYASSAVLYGDREYAPHKTGDRVYAADAYSRMKLAGEKAVLGSQAGVVARLANLYGPGMAGNNVVSTILRQIDADGPLVVRDETPVRDFVWAEDAADAIARMAMEGASGLFNVGSGEGVSIRQLATLALKLAGQGNRAVLASQPGGRSSCIVLDISATIGALGWSPRIDLEHGLGQLLRDRTVVQAGLSA